MRSMNGFAAVSILLLLAGCAGGSATVAPGSTPAGPTGVRDLEFEGDGGRIAGTITDSELVPIRGAQAAVGDLVVLTGEGGAFEFTNVPPGAHTIYASALGFNSVGKKVDVTAGETTQVSLLLDRLAVDEPFVDLQQNEGHICLQFGIAHPTGATSGIFVNFGNLACQNAGLIFIGFDVSPGVEAIVSEMVWQPTSGVTSRELRLSNWQGGARSGAFTQDHVYGVAAGPSPVTLKYGTLEGETFDGVDNETVTVDNAIIVPPDSSRPTGLNVVFDQRTTIYNSIFYGAEPEEEYTALPDT